MTNQCFPLDQDVVATSELSREAYKLKEAGHFSDEEYHRQAHRSTCQELGREISFEHYMQINALIDVFEDYAEAFGGGPKL